MKYNWNIVAWAVKYVPAVFGLPDIVVPVPDLIAVLLSPIESFRQELLDIRTETIKKLRYNGQVVIMENLLCDFFDPTLRRIRIVNAADTLDFVYLYGEEEVEYEQLYLWGNEPTDQPPSGLQHLFLYGDEEYALAADFIVKVPAGILTEASYLNGTLTAFKIHHEILDVDWNKNQFDALVSYYKLASKRFITQAI